MIGFLKKDISLTGRKKAKKLALKRQKKVIQLFSNLLASGFHLTEIVDFLERSCLLEKTFTQRMRQGLLSGASMADIFEEVGFSKDVVTQLSLADQHGHLEKSMATIQDYLGHLIQLKKKLIEVATYPMILMGFLILIMLGLKNYLIPQMEDDNLLITLIGHFPSFFLLGILAFMCCGLVIYGIWKKSSSLWFWSKLAQLPLVSDLVKRYLTAFYAREWGNLIAQGLEMMQIVALMQEQPSRLFAEVGADMQEALLSGQEFHHKVSTYPFFLKELGLMIEYGQVKSKLGSELTVYAEETWESFFTKLQRTTQLIQPIIFSLVAVMIVMVYAAMLLPMYQNMEINI